MGQRHQASYLPHLADTEASCWSNTSAGRQNLWEVRVENDSVMLVLMTSAHSLALVPSFPVLQMPNLCLEEIGVSSHKWAYLENSNWLKVPYVQFWKIHWGSLVYLEDKAEVQLSCDTRYSLLYSSSVVMLYCIAVRAELKQSTLYKVNPSYFLV